ncbi:MAG: TetR/AcrR family transcriptional regulator, partial [Cytophagia bacterium]
MGIAIVKINIPEKIYTRDPEQTNLGRKIIGHSIRLIDELGFEGFTYKKLATR